MKNKLFTLLGIVSFLLLFQMPHGYCQEETIAPKKLLKDVKQLEELLEAYPDPYTHVSEEVFKSKMDSLKASLDYPHTTLEFYQKIATMAALLKDGHSSVRLPKNWLKMQQKNRGSFPFEVHLTNKDELYIIKNFDESSSMPLGAQIIEINSLPVDDFISKIDPYISYELKPFRNTQIDGAFETYLYIAFGFTDETRLTYKLGDDITTVSVQNMDYKKWKSFQKDDREEKEILIAKGQPYSYKKLKKGVGLLTIYAFFAADMSNYDLFLSNTFKAIRKDSVHSLIIDIRGNFGGWPKVASRIFHYISEGYFKTMAKSSMKISSPYRNYFLDRLPVGVNKTDIPYISKRLHFIDINAVLRNPIGSYSDEDIFFNEEPQTETYEFNGDCYLLMNRDSYSAASSFASTFQCYQMGAIIGEDTGGTKIFRANSLHDVLSRSGLRVAMATTKLFTACYNEEFEGVKPNAYFTPTVQDICSGLDSQLFYLMGLINQVQKLRQKEKDGE